MTTRASLKYEVCEASSKRYKVSTIPHLQRLINKQAQLKKIEFRKLKPLSPVTLASSEDI